MSLNFGRTQMAIPGPSIVPERVLNAMHRASPNIYGGEIEDITVSIVQDLKTVARTSHDVAIYIANGHGVWEAALRNTIAPGEKVLALGTGHFTLSWVKMAKQIGIDVEYIDFGMQSSADAAKLYEILEADKGHAIKAVLMVQTDTASSVINDIEACRKAMDSAKHPALLMVDCIASLACDYYEMDAWGVDITIAACQKGLMTPAGVSFVFANQKAQDMRRGKEPGEYWDWEPRIRPELFYNRFDGTAPTHQLFGLREALTMLVHEEGMENVWARHKTIASSVWAAINHWNKDGSISHNIQDENLRSCAVSTIKMKQQNAKRLREWTEQKAGVTLGISLGFKGDDQQNHFRIGHMGHQNIPMIMGVLSAMDAGLKALDIPHNTGALDQATAILAAHS